MGAGRQLNKFRIKQIRWADMPYRKASCCPSYGRVQPKKPRIRINAYDSFISKCVKIHLINNGKKINAFIPDDGRLNYIEEDVLIAEFERKGHAVGDISFKTLQPRVKGRI